MKSEREEFVKEWVWSRWRIEITHTMMQGILRSHMFVIMTDLIAPQNVTIIKKY